MNLELTSIPIIVVSCYLLGELLKLCFIKVQSAYKFIPIITSLVGGGLGILIFFTGRELINAAKNVYDAFLIGLISGGSATACNQIVKQIVVKPIREAKNEGYNEAIQELEKKEENDGEASSQEVTNSDNEESKTETLFKNK